MWPVAMLPVIYSTKVTLKSTRVFSREETQFPISYSTSWHMQTYMCSANQDQSKRDSRQSHTHLQDLVPTEERAGYRHVKSKRTSDRGGDIGNIGAVSGASILKTRDGKIKETLLQI